MANTERRRTFTDYDVIRSKRKSIGVEITGKLRVLVRAPLGCTDQEIQNFVNRHLDWIDTHLQKMKERKQDESGQARLTAEELKELAEKAMQVIPERVAYYAPRLGVTCRRITIRNQKGRWGSCTTKGNLSFNCLLMLTPMEVIDSVVVHELCHLLEMNHSPRFYYHVLRVYPDYYKWNDWLKQHGSSIIHRMTGE